MQQIMDAHIFCMLFYTFSGVSNLWYGLWNGQMVWTDGMEYQLTKIAKITIVAVAKL